MPVPGSEPLTVCYYVDKSSIYWVGKWFFSRGCLRTDKKYPHSIIERYAIGYKVSSVGGEKVYGNPKIGFGLWFMPSGNRTYCQNRWQKFRDSTLARAVIRKGSFFLHKGLIINRGFQRPSALPASLAYSTCNMRHDNIKPEVTTIQIAAIGANIGYPPSHTTK